jgi:hypothetical protein
MARYNSLKYKRKLFQTKNYNEPNEKANAIFIPHSLTSGSFLVPHDDAILCVIYWMGFSNV